MRQGGTAAPDGFTEFVAARGPALHRTGMLLTHDSATAEDLVQTALVKAWRHWARIDQPEAYVRRIMVHQFASDRRRRWTGELPTDQPPEEHAAGDHAGSVADRQDLLAALAALPRKQRAVVVLRYFHDYTERQTAEVLGVSVGTVKSHTSRALAALRVRNELDRQAHGSRS